MNVYYTVFMILQDLNLSVNKIISFFFLSFFLIIIKMGFVFAGICPSEIQAVDNTLTPGGIDVPDINNADECKEWCLGMYFFRSLDRLILNFSELLIK